MHVPAAMQRFLRSALPILQADARLLGVAAAGSWTTGSLDEWSDLDLVVVSSDDRHADVMRDRLRVAESLGTLLGAFTGEHVGEPRLLVCLYDDPLLHVDLKFVSLSGFGQRVEDPVVLWERDGLLTSVIRRNPSLWPPFDAQATEDRFWIWIHYAAAHLERGELHDTLGNLTFLQAQVFGPMVRTLEGQRPRGVRHLERDSPAWAARLQDTVAGYEPISCARALWASVRLYRELRRRLAVPGLLHRHALERAAVTYARHSLSQLGAPVAENGEEALA